MESAKYLRKQIGQSQRVFAKRANISFRTLQLFESEKLDPKFSTLEKISRALGFRKDDFRHVVKSFFQEPPTSIRGISRSLEMLDLQKDWQILVFDFVDELRRSKNVNLIAKGPTADCPIKFKVLLTAIVETLCDEIGLTYPEWAWASTALKKPWFVAEIENLKASALVESPIHFKKRNIFVLDNFLKRA